jgi:predicted DNA-binding transcriptional regulator AlpA
MQTVRPTDDQWLSLSEFAHIVGKSPATIYNEISLGKDLPPYYKFKQYIRFRKSDVDTYLEKHRCVTASAQLAEGPRAAPIPPARAGQTPRPWEARRTADTASA